MEKQAERRREPEPLIFLRAYEERYALQKRQAEKLSDLPRVVKYNDVPWMQDAQARAKFFSGGTMLHQRLDRIPICTFSVLQQIVAPGNRSGLHRHYFEAIFYVLEGEGYEVHDGVKYPWEAGDIICVPTYCVHQHFNTSPDRWARLFFSTPLVFELMGISHTEMIQLHPDYRPPEDAKLIRNPKGEMVGYETKEGVKFVLGADLNLQKSMEAQKAVQFTGESKTIYDHYVKLTVEQNKRRQSVPHVIKERDVPWENTRMGRIKYIVSPFKPSPLLIYDCFIQELPPGGRSGVHRHVSEEVHQILEGRGYDIQDGKRWDWEKEDIVLIPINTVHQHVNADPHHPARFVAFQSRLYHYVGHGGFEHIEDAPGYKP